MLSVNFSRAEMACRGTTCGCGGLARFHSGFMARLQMLRTEFGKSMTVNSGCRCNTHNSNVGGHPKSLHVGNVDHHPGQTGCLAADIATPDGAYRGELFALAWRHGFSIGWNAKKGFLHLDRRDFVGLSQNSFDY